MSDETVSKILSYTKRIGPLGVILMLEIHQAGGRLEIRPKDLDERFGVNCETLVVYRKRCERCGLLRFERGTRTKLSVYELIGDLA